MTAFRELWLLIRDKFTFWWLVSVCDCPEAAWAYSRGEMDKALRQERLHLDRKS